MIYTTLFLIALGLSVAGKFWLNQRQLRYVAAHRDAVPDAFSDKISLQAHQKAADYTAAKAGLGRWVMLYDVLILLGWTLGGGIEAVNTWISGFGLSYLASGALLILTVIAVSGILHLPFSIYSTFVIEKRFGFNKTTVKTYISDLIKGGIIGLLIGTPVILLILWLMQASGSYWWIYTWAAWMAFGLLISWAFPTFIAPLFNKFTPLDDDQLRSQIQTLLDRAGFKSNGIFVMDGSRRSGHGNAYFTGLGKNKRIVFFDTLLDTLSAKETLAVLAHELGHFKHKHILKGLVVGAITSLAGFAILAWLLPQDSFFHQLGVATPSFAAALILFAMVSPLFSWFLQPLSAWWSRKHEFEADAFAREQTSGEDLSRALINLYRDNASTLTPDPVYTQFYASHPPALERIAHLKNG